MLPFAVLNSENSTASGTGTEYGTFISLSTIYGTVGEEAGPVALDDEENASVVQHAGRVPSLGVKNP